MIRCKAPEQCNNEVTNGRLDGAFHEPDASKFVRDLSKQCKIPFPSRIVDTVRDQKCVDVTTCAQNRREELYRSSSYDFHDEAVCATIVSHKGVIALLSKYFAIASV